MECGAQLGPYRPQAPPDPYGRNPNDPYGGQQGGPPPGPYGQQPPPGPYGQQPPNPYGGPVDPYGSQGQGNPYGGQQGGPPPIGGQGSPYGGYGGGQQGYGAPEPAPYQPPAPAVAKLILESGLGKVDYALDAGVVAMGRSL